jgi:hypothetical protein
MSGLGARHVWEMALWNPVRNPDKSGLTWNFGDKIVFDDLHFTDSPNAPPLIVQSSWDSNKI